MNSQNLHCALGDHDRLPGNRQATKTLPAFRKLSLNSFDSVSVLKITFPCAKRWAQLVKWLPWQKEDPISGPLCDMSVCCHAHIINLRTMEAETGRSLELTDQQALHGVNPSFSAGPCLKI